MPRVQQFNSFCRCSKGCTSNYSAGEEFEGRFDYLCVSACLQMKSVASWLAFLLDVSADPRSPCLSLAGSSWSSSAGLMLCELPAVGEEKEEISHHPVPTVQDKCFLFVVPPSFPCFCAFFYILFFRCCSAQVPSLLVCRGSCRHPYNLLLKIWDSPLFSLTLCQASCELLISQRSL